MIRARIVRTLLYKEALRYRYNWGLLVMVVALLALAALVSISARLGKLPGQGGQAISACFVAFNADDSRARDWAAYLSQVAMPEGLTVRLWELHENVNAARPPQARPQSMVIALAPSRNNRGEVWKAYHFYPEEAAAATFPYRDWFAQVTQRFLRSAPSFEEETRKMNTDLDRTDPVPFVVTALTIFALYLLSFNLYITSTGEEREKRQMLGLLLSPATPAEVIAAKAIFYGVFSLGVSLAVAGMYQPRLLLRPLLWSTVFLGSLSYVAIGTVIVSVIRRQTTINTVSMLYLISTSIAMILAPYLPVFVGIKFLMIEDYLYRQMHQIVSDQAPWWRIYNQLALAVLTLVWTIIALEVFKRRSTAISQAR
jgi:ABC-2 family transporter protein